jgi:hypothetical protein
MSDLINSIRAAQVRAAEDLVLESLRASGLVVDEPLSEADQLAALKRDMLDKHRAAERAAYAYFGACPVGDERIRASEVYENIRTATRVG